MASRYASVSGLVKSLTDDETFRSEFEKEIANKIVAKNLFTLRCRKGLTQAQMAQLLGCTQGTISKLESSAADSIKVSDLIAYAKALDCSLFIAFQTDRTLVGWVKFHAFQMKKHLDHLAKLAHKDKDINKGVTRFFNEALFNVVNFILNSAKLLPRYPELSQPTLQMSSQNEMEEPEMSTATN